MQTRIMASIICVFGFLTSQAQAHVSSVSAATGSAGRASIESLDTPFLNPAALPYKKGYFFGTGYSRFRSDGLGDTDVFSVSLTDNMKDTVMPTAFGFVNTKYLQDRSSWDRRDLRLGVGNFLFKRHAVGGGIAYRNSRGDNYSSEQFNLYLGGIMAVRRELSVGLLLENLVSPSTNVAVQERLNPSTAVALSYNYLTFMRVKADLISESNNGWAKPTLALGLESYFNKWLIVRIGYQRNAELEQSITSAGLGFGGPRFGIHYAFQNVQSPLGLDPRHSVDLGVPIW